MTKPSVRMLGFVRSASRVYSIHLAKDRPIRAFCQVNQRHEHPFGQRCASFILSPPADHSLPSSPAVRLAIMVQVPSYVEVPGYAIPIQEVVPLVPSKGTAPQPPSLGPQTFSSASPTSSTHLRRQPSVPKQQTTPLPCSCYGNGIGVSRVSRLVPPTPLSQL